MNNDMLVAAAIAKLSNGGWPGLNFDLKSCLAEVILGSLPKQFIMELATHICTEKAKGKTPEFGFKIQQKKLILNLEADNNQNPELQNWD